VAGAVVNALMAPLLDLQATVGSGVFTGDDPSRMLRDAGRLLTDVVAAGAAGASGVGAVWSGVAANTASQSISTALNGAADLATHASVMAGRVSNAADAVAHAKGELQRIIDEFAARAHALEGHLPESAGALADAARTALSDAMAVVAELEAELDGHAAAVAEPAAAQAPATSPAALSPSSGWYPQSSAVPTMASGLLGAAPEIAHAAHDAVVDPGTLGDGVAVRLPDGSTVTAPNPVAAQAVRHALTQLGVPYDWGAEAPGVGFDCSGLTQWAYHEAGLNLPRLAQEQDIGAAVSAGALLPGDLAVWDGHVAMIVGNGTMIEAGDPVQLSPIRNTNAGQGFQGFWRPTA
jgi:peptidoglycan DL-endopeptidase CwlO